MNRAEVSKDGKFLDANTHKPIEGKYDIGHRYGHEFWREEEAARRQGVSQAEFNDHMNNPDFYQIEDCCNNRSHQFEMPRDVEPESAMSEAGKVAIQTRDDGLSQSQPGSVEWIDEQGYDASSHDQYNGHELSDQGMEM